MIDITVTYLNEHDEKWKQDFEYWKNKEIKEGRTKASNRQAFGKERTREWDIFKYWFRAVEKNCPWVNKIFLIVQNERHIPKWLNINHPKLRIVYHNEYIPKDLLPTFNAMTIGIYISNIKDLSDNYIMCDDDYFFLNKIEEDRFFRNDVPVHKDTKIHYGLYKNEYLKGTDRVFFHILNNDLIFETKYMKEKVKYGIYHLPEARKKSFEQMIIKENEEEIKKRNSYSKFRHKTNLCSYMYNDLIRIFGKAIIDDPYKNSSYCTLKSNVDFNIYSNKDMVCFNDTEQLDDYEKTKEKLIDFLEKKFPNKSSYEKEGQDE